MNSIRPDATASLLGKGEAQTFRTLGKLRSILRKRRQGRGRGRGSDHQRWPNHIFAKAGLFALMQARQLACQSLKRAP